MVCVYAKLALPINEKSRSNERDFDKACSPNYLFPAPNELGVVARVEFLFG